MGLPDERYRNRRNEVINAPIVKYAGGSATPKATFKRPANTDAYVAGDIILPADAQPMEFLAAREFANSFILIKARLRKSSPELLNAAFVLHLFTQKPTPANPDGQPFSTDKSAAYIGSFDIFTMRAFSDGAVGVGSPTVEGPICVEIQPQVADPSCGATTTPPNTRTVYGLLEVRAAYVPVAEETFEVTLEVQQD